MTNIESIFTICFHNYENVVIQALKEVICYLSSGGWQKIPEISCRHPELDVNSVQRPPDGNNGVLALPRKIYDVTCI